MASSSNTTRARGASGAVGWNLVVPSVVFLLLLLPQAWVTHQALARLRDHGVPVEAAFVGIHTVVGKAARTELTVRFASRQGVDNVVISLPPDAPTEQYARSGRVPIVYDPDQPQVCLVKGYAVGLLEPVLSLLVCGFAAGFAALGLLLVGLAAAADRREAA